MIKKTIKRIRRYQLTIAMGAALAVLVVISFLIFAQLVSASMEKASAIRGEFVQRDLRELVGRFDADERFTFEHNIEKLLEDKREITPLLLPRQYYVGLPPQGMRGSPRQPPRNCYITLLTQNPTDQNSTLRDKVCPYFAENKALGKYLFLAATITDNSIVPLNSGDTTLSADALKVTVVLGEKSASWWLTLQSPPATNLKERYEITAFRINPNRTQERDKRVEGWAYSQRQSDGSQIIQLVARIDFKEFDTTRELSYEGEWPPKDWENIRLKFARRDVAKDDNRIKNIEFSQIGISNLSMTSLAESIYSNHANLMIVGKGLDNEIHIKNIKSPILEKGKNDFQIGPVSVIEGDLLIATDNIVKAQILPDTSLSLVVTHPGSVIEKGIWQTLIGLSLLFITVAGVAIYFFRNLLTPIFVLTRHSLHLVSYSDSDSQLPYSDKVNEIGTLARGFNGLLKETQIRAARELSDREARQAEQNLRELDEIKVRESNLKVIGHEIRSPLQALISLHNDDESRRYIDRILAALPHLQGSMSPEDAFGDRPLTLERIDIAAFSSEVAINAQLQSIKDVIYDGPLAGIYCEVDDGAIEDAVTHILVNADRFKVKFSSIQIKLACDENRVSLSISNLGPCIKETDIDQIFNYGFTTTPKDSIVGTGVGLFVAKNYVTRMKGTIEVKNIDGGVCFEIVLPRVN